MIGLRDRRMRRFYRLPYGVAELPGQYRGR